MNKRFMKVITLILSCLLLIGAAVGITVAAEDGAPAVSIEKKNVAYEGAIQLVYLVTANNLPEGAVPAIRFEANNKDAYVKTAAGTVTLSEVEYDAIYSDGIVAKEYRLALKSTPGYVLNGEFIEAGEAEKFSAYDYAMTRFDGTYSNAQFNLYKALLDYGAAVQTVLEYNDESVLSLGGWIDEYYVFTINGEETVIRGKNAADVADYVAAAPAEGKVLEGWKVNGKHANAWNSISLDVIGPGHKTVETVYGDKHQATVEFSTADDLKHFSSVTNSDYMNRISVADGVAKISTTGWSPLNFAQGGDKSACGYGAKHVFEADMKISGLAAVSKTDILSFLGFQTTVNGGNEGTTLQGQGQEEELYSVPNTTEFVKIGGYNVPTDEWFNFRYEITVSDDENVGDLVELYVNNVCVYSKTTWTKSQDGQTWQVAYNTLGKTVVGFNFTPRSLSPLEIALDNAYCFSEGNPMPLTVNLDVNGGNALESTSQLVYLGKDYTLPVPTHPDFVFGGWYYGETAVAEAGAWAVTEDNATLKAKWLIYETGNENNFDNQSIVNGIISGASYVDGKLVTTPVNWNNHFFSFGTSETVYGPYPAGTKYVFEADFAYLGGADPTLPGGDRDLAFVGFCSSYSHTNGNMPAWGYLSASSVASDEGDSAYVTLFGLTFNKGVSYKVRYEYIVGDGVHVYCNDKYVGKASTTNGGGSPYLMEAFAWYARRMTADIKFSYDNVKTSILTPTESQVTLDANYGALPEDAATEMTFVYGNDYELPTPTVDGLSFKGWYNGDTLVPTSGKWAIRDNVTLVADWEDVSAPVVNDSAVSLAGKNGEVYRFNSDGTAAIELPGTIFTFTAKFTYKGLTSFKLDASGKVVAQKDGAQYGYVRASGSQGNGSLDGAFGSGDYVTTSGNFVTANGESALNADGTLREGLELTDVFFENIKFAGGTFKINTEYEIVLNFTVLGDGKGSCTGIATALDESGATQNLSIGGWKKVYSISQFYFEYRTAKNIGVTDFNANSEIAAGSSFVTSRPVWNNIALDVNGGALADGTVTEFAQLKGQSFTLPTPTREGYEFLGWFDGETKYESCEAWVMAGKANLTLTAKWLAPKTVVTLNAGEGTFDGETTLTIDNATAYVLPTPTLAGYAFDGWYNGEELVATSGDAWSVNLPAVTLVAAWTKNVSVVTYDAGAGTVSSATQEVANGEAYELLTPTYDGYTFLGWYNGDALVAISGDAWNVNGDVALTAKWARTNSTATLNLDGGVGETTYTFTYGEAYTLPTVTKEGLVFVAWYNGYHIFPATGVWYGEEDVTLTAKWATSWVGNFTDFSDGQLPDFITSGAVNSFEDGKLTVTVGQSAGPNVAFWPDAPVTNAPVGTKFVMEFDFTYVQGTPSSADGNLAMIGLSSTDNGWQTGAYKADDLRIYNDYLEFYGNKLNKGQTHTVRFEFTVGADNTGTLEIFIDGVQGTANAAWTNSVTTANMIRFNFQFRGKGTAGGTTIITFDNVTVGIEGPAAN